MVELKISTDNLLFNHQHHIKTYVGNIDVSALESAEIYAVVTHITKNPPMRIYHFYHLNSQIIVIHTHDGKATVTVTNRIEDIAHNLLLLQHAGSPFCESLDIPVTLFLGLQNSSNVDEIIQNLVTHTNISLQHATNLVNDMRSNMEVERYEIIDKKKQCTSFLTFLQGTQQLWSITYSSTAGNIIIQSIDQFTYHESALAFLKELSV
jgi:hypothetical protein